MVDQERTVTQLAARGARAEVYMIEAYSKIRSLGAALAVAGLLAAVGSLLLLAGAASYKYYVNATTGEPLPPDANFTRADILEGRVEEVTAVNTTLFTTLISTGIAEAASAVLVAAEKGTLAFYGYSQLSFLFALVALLAAAGVTRSASMVLMDYSKTFKAGVLGGWLKLAGTAVLFLAFWQARGAINEASEPLMIGALGLYYLGGALALVGTLLFSIPMMLSAHAINAPAAVRAAAALAALGALVTFLAVNTSQLILGPLLCLAAGLAYAVPASRVLRVLQAQQAQPK